MSVTVYTKKDPSSLILGCPSLHSTRASFVPNFSHSVRSCVTQTFFCFEYSPSVTFYIYAFTLIPSPLSAVCVLHV